MTGTGASSIQIVVRAHGHVLLAGDLAGPSKPTVLGYRHRVPGTPRREGPRTDALFDESNHGGAGEVFSRRHGVLSRWVAYSGVA